MVLDTQEEILVQDAGGLTGEVLALIGRRNRGDSEVSRRLQLVLCEAYHQLGQPLERFSLREMASASPELADPVSLQALVAAGQGDLDEANRLLGQAARRRPLLFWRGSAATRREIAGRSLLEALRR